MSSLAQLLLQLIPMVPTAIQQVTALYEQVRGLLSPSDQQAIEAALVSAQASDAAATAQADAALSLAATKPSGEVGAAAKK